MLIYPQDISQIFNKVQRQLTYRSLCQKTDPDNLQYNIFMINTSSTRILKFFFHPGYPGTRKLVLPICPPSLVSTYYQPVWGNQIQSQQLSSQHKYSFSTDQINYYSKATKTLFNDTPILLPTSHNTPISTALHSCRNLEAQKYLKKLENLQITDKNGIFINSQENRQKALKVAAQQKDQVQRDILTGALYGIFSNYGDSIYIANDYLQVANSYCIISNYPNKVAQRQIQRARVVATALRYGNMPIILDRDVVFQGQPNIKYISAKIIENSKQYQVCLSYDSNRSDSRAVDNINYYLQKLNQPLLYPINIKPRVGTQGYFYHMDCIINFFSNQEQVFKSKQDFWKNYQPNGVAIVAKQGFTHNQTVLLSKLFKEIVQIDIKEDLLAVNMIIKSDGVVGTSKIHQDVKTKLRQLFPVYIGFQHPSTGGGGAHKCCSNVITVGERIELQQWKRFVKTHKMHVTDAFIQSVHRQSKRLFDIDK